jgi:hypothetical protein
MPQNALLQAVTSRIAALQAHPVDTIYIGPSVAGVSDGTRPNVEITLPVWLRNRESPKKLIQKASDA